MNNQSFIVWDDPMTQALVISPALPRTSANKPRKPATQREASPRAQARQAKLVFAPHERSSIDFFVRMAGILGVQKSTAEIYGLLYVCPQPIGFPEIERRLALSKGSVSAGLRFLKEHGMVEAKRLPRVRADLWSVTPSLAGALATLVSKRVQPALQSSAPELRSLQEQAAAGGVPAAVAERIARLSHWNSRALELLPLLLARPPSS